MTGGADRRRPVLSASVGPAAATAIQALIGTAESRERLSLYRDVFASVDPLAGAEVSRALAEIAEAARQWGEWQRAGAFAGESVQAVAAKAAEESVPMELTTGQAAERIGCTPQRVGQLVKAGRLVARMSGRSWLVETTSVEAYMSRSTT